MAKQVQSEADRIAAEELANNPVAPKGHATPTRKEREAARKRPLVGGKTPEARTMSKDQQRDRGPQKRFIRDFVDSRWGFAELTIPILGLFVIIGLVLPGLANYVNYGLWALVVLIVIDVIVLYFTLKRRLAEKFGADRVERIGLYHATRAIQVRPMRLPKPRVKRGERPS